MPNIWQVMASVDTKWVQSTMSSKKIRRKSNDGHLYHRNASDIQQTTVQLEKTSGPSGIWELNWLMITSVLEYNIATLCWYCLWYWTCNFYQMVSRMVITRELAPCLWLSSGRPTSVGDRCLFQVQVTLASWDALQGGRFWTDEVILNWLSNAYML